MSKLINFPKNYSWYVLNIDNYFIHLENKMICMLCRIIIDIVICPGANCFKQVEKKKSTTNFLDLQTNSPMQQYLSDFAKTQELLQATTFPLRFKTKLLFPEGFYWLHCITRDHHKSYENSLPLKHFRIKGFLIFYIFKKSSDIYA